MAAVIKVVTVVGREAKGKCLTSATAMLTTDDEATFDSAYIIEPKKLNWTAECRRRFLNGIRSIAACAHCGSHPRGKDKRQKEINDRVISPVVVGRDSRELVRDTQFAFAFSLWTREPSRWQVIHCSRAPVFFPDLLPLMASCVVAAALAPPYFTRPIEVVIYSRAIFTTTATAMTTVVDRDSWMELLTLASIINVNLFL